MRKKNFAQKTMILLVLFALVFGSIFTEQVKAEPLDADEVESTEAVSTEPDLSATAEPGNNEPDAVEPELETSETIVNDPDQKSNEEANEEVNPEAPEAPEANDAVPTESESETGAAGSETEDSELSPEPGTEETTETTEAATEPTEAATEPTEAATEPTEAATEPTEAGTEPTEPAEEVAEPTSQTTEAELDTETSETEEDPDPTAIKDTIEDEITESETDSIAGQSRASHSDFVIDPNTGVITDYTGAGGELSIPAYISGIQVKEIGSGAFKMKGLTKVTIPYTVTAIRAGAFRENKIASVTIPGSVRVIDDAAFYRNKLTGVKIPNSVTSIGKSAFEYNLLTSVIIPDTVKYVFEYAFYNNNLTYVKLSNSLETIHKGSFRQNHLTSLTIPDSVKTIEQSAFNDNHLEEVTIPNSVVTIYAYAFYNNKLTEVVIPRSVKNIGYSAFRDNRIVQATVPRSFELYQPGSGSSWYYDYSMTKILGGIFDSGVAISYHADLTRYIKAKSIIRDSPNGNRIALLWRPLFVSGYYEGSWFRFTYNGEPAYVAAGLVTTGNPAMTGYAKQNLYVRNTPNGSIIGTIPIGRQVQGVLVGNMVRITHNGQTGYIYAVLLQANPVRISRYVMADSNIRTSPNGSIVYKSRLPFYVTGTIRGSWLHYKVGDADRYVYLTNLTSSSPSITGYASGKLNVRRSPNGSLIGSYPIGRQISGTLIREWVRVNYNGQTGYVYAKNLQAVPVRLKCYVLANSIIRSSPNGSIISRPWRPYLVTGTIQGAWLRYTNNGRSSYVAMSSTTTKNPPITGYAKQTLYVRYTPNGNVVATLPAGYRVSGVLVGNMVRFTYNGRTSYVYAVFLRK